MCDSNRWLCLHALNEKKTQVDFFVALRSDKSNFYDIIMFENSSNYQNGDQARKKMLFLLPCQQCTANNTSAKEEKMSI